MNNAGVEFNSPLLDTDIAEAKRLYDVNVWALLLWSKRLRPAYQGQGSCLQPELH